jgi:hypothetical protein
LGEGGEWDGVLMEMYNGWSMRVEAWALRVDEETVDLHLVIN